MVSAQVARSICIDKVKSAALWVKGREKLNAELSQAFWG